MKILIKFKNIILRKKQIVQLEKQVSLSLDLISKNLPNLIGGSADLTGSNNTKTKDMKIISTR